MCFPNRRLLAVHVHLAMPWVGFVASILCLLAVLLAFNVWSERMAARDQAQWAERPRK